MESHILNLKKKINLDSLVYQLYESTKAFLSIKSIVNSKKISNIINHFFLYLVILIKVHKFKDYLYQTFKFPNESSNLNLLLYFKSKFLK